LRSKSLTSPWGLRFGGARGSIPACQNGSAGRVLPSRLTASVGQGFFAYFLIKGESKKK